MIKNTVVISLLIVLSNLLILNPLFAQETNCADLQVQIKECEAILDMTGPLISAQNRKISLLEAQIENLSTQRAELENQLQSTRAPWYLRAEYVAPTAFILGFIINERIK